MSFSLHNWHWPLGRGHKLRRRGAGHRGAGIAAILILLLALLPATPMLAQETTAGRPVPGAGSSGHSKDIESSVVKVYVRANPPDLLSPWQKAGVESATGSGVVIDGKRILTNAHVVEDGVSIEVRNRNMSQRYVAEVEFINHDCDLALLAVEDESFFASSQPIEIGRMPEARTKLEVYGYPVGGETMSVTSGIISRIEVGIYAHSMQRLLIAQIDAAINAGNSGGPVLAGSQLVGIATQALDDAENVGYMIPVSVVRHFIEDVQDGHVDGFPSLGFKAQELDSPALRESLGMSGSQTGVLVAWVDHGSPADGSLRPRDVLLEMEGLPIANDGTVAWPYVGRVHFSEVFRSKQVGERVTIRVLRDGEVLEQEITLTRQPRLVPGRRLSELPQYFVFGGLLFQPLTADYLAYFEETPHDLGVYYYHRDRVTAERKQIILIQKVLPHPVNRGYQTWEDYVVETVNGVVPRDMEHLAALIDNASGPFLQIVTEDKSFLTLDLAAARAAGRTILDNFGLPYDRSPDLRASQAATAAVLLFLGRGKSLRNTTAVMLARTAQ